MAAAAGAGLGAGPKLEFFRNGAKLDSQPKTTTTRIVPSVLINGPKKTKEDAKDVKEDVKLASPNAPAAAAAPMVIGTNKDKSTKAAEPLPTEPLPTKAKAAEPQKISTTLNIFPKLKDIFFVVKISTTLKPEDPWSLLDDSKYLQTLSIFPKLKDIFFAVAADPVTHVMAPTGTGKTIGIPHMMFRAMDSKALTARRMLVAVPTVTIAEKQFVYMVINNRSLVGQMNLISGPKATKPRKDPKAAQITFGTYASMYSFLLRMWLSSNPQELNETVIMIDEAHHESEARLLLQSLVQKLLMENFQIKVIMTSATLRPNEEFSWLSVPEQKVVHCQVPKGRVMVHWHGTDLYRQYGNDDDQFQFHLPKVLDAVVTIVKEIVTKNDFKTKSNQDILIFMPGQNEIEQLCQLLDDKKAFPVDVAIIPFHSHLEPDERQKAFDADDEKRRKIIVATNGLETGVTIEGLGFVIDTGLHKYHKHMGDYKKIMETVISQDMSIQRRGRIGRIPDAGGPDHYFPLFTEAFLDDFMPPSRASSFEDLPKGKHVLKWLQHNLSAADVVDLLNSEDAETTYEKIVGDLEALDLIRSSNDKETTSAGYSVTKFGEHVLQLHCLDLEGSTMLVKALAMRNIPLADIVHLIIALAATHVQLTQSTLWRVPYPSKEDMRKMDKPALKQHRQHLKTEFMSGLRKMHAGQNDMTCLVHVFGKFLETLNRERPCDVWSGIDMSTYQKKGAREFSAIVNEWSKSNGVDRKALVSFYRLWSDLEKSMIVQRWFTHVQVEAEALMDVFSDVRHTLQETFDAWAPFYAKVYGKRKYRRNESMTKATQPMYTLKHSDECNTTQWRMDNKTISALADVTVHNAPDEIIAMGSTEMSIAVKSEEDPSNDRTITLYILTLCFPIPLDWVDGQQQDDDGDDDDVY